jgi:hypothetical protein
MSHVASAVAASAAATAAVRSGGWAPSTATPRVNGILRPRTRVAATVLPGGGGRKANVEVPSQLTQLTFHSSSATTGGRGDSLVVGPAQIFPAPPTPSNAP